MPTRIENLERLARFRADGLLTDAEFEAEKAKLLALPLDGGEEVPNGDGPDQIDPSAGRFNLGRWAWGIAIAFLLGTVALAWDRFGVGGESAVAGGQGVIDQLAGADPLWVKSETVDPMTDLNVVSAQRTFEVDQFLIETTISCAQNGTLSYKFLTFFADKSAANFVEQYNSNGYLLRQATFRLDDQDAKSELGIARFSNSIEIERRLFQVEDSAKAQQITVKLQLQNGDPVVVIDQMSPAVRQVLDQCVEAAQAQAEKATADKQLKVQDLQKQYDALSAIPENRRSGGQALALVNLRREIRMLQENDSSWTSQEIRDHWRAVDPQSDAKALPEQDADSAAIDSRNQADKLRNAEDEAQRQQQQEIQNKEAEERERRREAQRRQDQEAFCNTITPEGRKNAEYVLSKGC